MRIWFDTEFVDDGKTIELLSIGLVREDGRELYRESGDFNFRRPVDPWMVKNVYPHLAGEKYSRAEIARDILNFAGKSPEFWADYAAYDWVVLCQLYGRMVDVPDGWPWYCMDVQQLQHQFDDAYVQPPDFVGQQHHALDDARHCRRLWTYLTTTPIRKR